MNKEDIIKFTQMNNTLIEIIKDINHQFIELEEDLIKRYKDSFGDNAFYTYIERYPNPFKHSDYIYLMSEKYDDGIMSVGKGFIELNGYVEIRDFGLDTYKFYVDIDLIENYDNKEYLKDRINKIVSTKIENEYQKSKKFLEEEQKHKDEMENLKKDKEYQLYLDLKKKYGDDFEIILRR